MDANQTQTTVSLFLPCNDREYLETKGLQYLEIQESGKNGLVIENYRLPESKFTITQSSLLIFIPSGYADISPDMFYFFPALTLINNRYPAQADVFEMFAKNNWQRWSRHAPADQWRSGIDGIHTYLQRVNEALRVAT